MIYPKMDYLQTRANNISGIPAKKMAPENVASLLDDARGYFFQSVICGHARQIFVVKFVQHGCGRRYFNCETQVAQTVFVWNHLIRTLFS